MHTQKNHTKQVFLKQLRIKESTSSRLIFEIFLLKLHYAKFFLSAIANLKNFLLRFLYNRSRVFTWIHVTPTTHVFKSKNTNT